MRYAKTDCFNEGVIDDGDASSECRDSEKSSVGGNIGSQCVGSNACPTLHPSSPILIQATNARAQWLGSNAFPSTPGLPCGGSTVNGPSVVVSPDASDEGPLVMTGINRSLPMRPITVRDMLDDTESTESLNSDPRWKKQQERNRKRREFLERERQWSEEIGIGRRERGRDRKESEGWTVPPDIQSHIYRDVQNVHDVAYYENRRHKVSNRPNITWLEDVQRNMTTSLREGSDFQNTSRVVDTMHGLARERPRVGYNSTFSRGLPWTPCATKDCVMPKGHRTPHEIWKRCGFGGCLRHQGHDGDHMIRSEELRDAAIRLERQAKAAGRYWRELAVMVLEAMGYPRPEGRRREKMAKTTTRSVKNTTMKVFIPPPILLRGEPSSPYRRLALYNRQIRLFQLEPGITASGITGSFICAELSSRPSYTALSYTWGDMETGRKITISNQGKLTVGDNLWSFLCVQSSVITQPTSFWIDAICIDQSNVHERNHQVGLMKHIYANATKVYVWLGREAESSDIAMRFVTAQASKPLRPRGPGYYPLWTRQQGEALHTLCERLYWRRMWIIQELLHAEDITVWCGSLHFSWGDIEKLYLKLKIVEDSQWFAHHEFHMRVMQSSAAVMIWQRAHWRHPDTPVPRLPTLIKIFRDWQCTDLRDKVFALSGMATEESAVAPNYALTVREVYLAVMENVQREDKEQFGALLSQTVGLAGRDIDLHGQNMIEYRTPDAQRLVLKARQMDWTDGVV